MSPAAGRAVVWPLIAALVVTLAGCGAGFDAATLQFSRAKLGAAGESGHTLVRNAVLVAADERGANRAALVVTFVNNADNPDVVTGVTVHAQGAWRVDGGSIEIPSRGTVTTTWAQGPPITVHQIDGELLPGRFLLITFSFQRGAALTLDVLIRAPAGPYAL
jgi:hypothetical protein